MALTKNERRALELVQQRIAADGDYFICNQLDEAAVEAVCSRQEAERLKNYIASALGERTLFGWQRRYGVISNGEDSHIADRLAWIDWMLGKPLPGEAVKLEWREKSDECEEAEYCGRRFLLTWADWNSRYVVTEPYAAYHVVAELPMNRRDEVDAAIVAHVWPEA